MFSSCNSVYSIKYTTASFTHTSHLLSGTLAETPELLLFARLCECSTPVALACTFNRLPHIDNVFRSGLIEASRLLRRRGSAIEFGYECECRVPFGGRGCFVRREFPLDPSNFLLPVKDLVEPFRGVVLQCVQSRMFTHFPILAVDVRARSNVLSISAFLSDLLPGMRAL